MKLPSEEKLGAIAKLLLRCLLGTLMLLHGIHKVLHGIDGVRSLMVEQGLPAFVAPGVYVGEVIAPFLLIVGFATRPAALVFSFNMVVAILTAHAAQIFALGKHGEYPLELQMLFLVGGLVVALLGPGSYAVPPLGLVCKAHQTSSRRSLSRWMTRGG